MNAAQVENYMATMTLDRLIVDDGGIMVLHEQREGESIGDRISRASARKQWQRDNRSLLELWAPLGGDPLAPTGEDGRLLRATRGGLSLCDESDMRGCMALATEAA